MTEGRWLASAVGSGTELDTNVSKEAPPPPERAPTNMAAPSATAPSASGSLGNETGSSVIDEVAADVCASFGELESSSEADA